MKTDESENHLIARAKKIAESRIAMLVVGLTLAACQKVSVPEEYSQLNFAGLDSVSINDSGKVVLSWNAVDSTNTDGLAVNYLAYMKELTASESGLLEEADAIRAVDLTEDDQPKKSGSLLSSTSSTSLVVDADLTSGQLYAFQVVASAGSKDGDNSKVYGLFYVKEAGSEFNLSTVKGNFQSSSPSTELSNPLTVELTKSNKPEPGQVIGFTITDGGGALSAAKVVTDESGQAAVSYTAPVSGGNAQVTANWLAGGKSVEFTILGNSTSSQQDSNADTKVLEAVSGNFQVAAKSTTFPTPLLARLRDGLVPLSGKAISFAVTSSPAGQTGGAVSAASVLTDTLGQAQVDFTSGDIDGSYIITATWTDGTVTKTTTFAEIVTTSLASSSKIIKIVASGAGSQPEVGTASLDLLTDTLAVKAAFFDLTGTTYLSDATVAWSLVGGGFNATDLVGTASNSTSITFDPTRTGTTILQATYMGSDTSVIGTTDTTGFLTVATTAVPGIFTIQAGNNQTATVNNNLTTPLKVKVTDTLGTAIPGVGVNFDVQQGGGTVVTGQPVVTDANGYCEAVVKLGTVAGANVFRATVVSTPSLVVDFNATGTVAAASKLLITTQPAGAYANFIFLTQPIVTVTDQYNNLITSPAVSVSISRTTGTGTVSGTTTMTTSSGVATFTDLSYDVQENGVVITAASTGITSAVSNAFNVGPLIGACVLQDAGWTTLGGGCKDITTGLIWTNKSTAMNWHDAIWDNQVALADVQDVGDFGRTNGYDVTSGCYGNCDNSATSYCKSLNQNGYTDWRLPSKSELASAYSNGSATHLADMASELVWSSTTDLNTTKSFGVNLSSGTQTATDKTTTLKVYCVRGGRVAADRVAILRASGQIKTNTTDQGIIAQIKDSAGNNVHAQGVTITLTTNSGVISGTTTGVTDKHGQVVMSAWQINTTGAGVLTASAAGLTSGTWNYTGMTGFTHNCAADDTRFKTADGGCKDLSSGLVWSLGMATTLNWHDSVWGSELSGNAASNADDYGSINDYANGYVPGTYRDNSTSNYCHELSEGGNNDWRMPTVTELMAVAGAARANTHFASSSLTGYRWSSATLNGYNDYAWRVRLSDGSPTWDYKSSGYYVNCVRVAPLTVAVASHTCAIEDANFATAGGGCKDLSSGLSWSMAAPTGLKWDDAVWSSALTNNKSPDLYDGNRVDDYDGGVVPSTYKDSSPINYCHELVEGGYSDWRLPSLTEILNVSGAAKAGNHFNVATTSYFWTSKTLTGYNDNANMVRLSDGNNSWDLKSSQRPIICVRP